MQKNRTYGKGTLPKGGGGGCVKQPKDRQKLKVLSSAL